MPKKDPTSKHPALVANRLKEQSEMIADMDQEELEMLRGWSHMNDNEKKWLALYAWYGEPARTSRSLGLSYRYHHGRVRDNPYFKDAMQTRRWTAVRIARMVAIDALGMATVTLSMGVDPNNPLQLDGKTRLGFVQLIYNLTGLLKNAEPAHPFGGNTFINT